VEERVTAVTQPHPGHELAAAEVRDFVKSRIGSVKAPKQVEVWPDLPRFKIGKVLKTEIKSRLLTDDLPPSGRNRQQHRLRSAVDNAH
jgi:fatty-acyl-CoA synthase